MFDQALVGRKLGSGYMLAFADYAWNQAGAFCVIAECGDLTLLHEDAFSIVTPRWIVLGNRAQYDGHDLQHVVTPSGRAMFSGNIPCGGSQYSHVATTQYSTVVYYNEIARILPDLVSYIGLCGIDLQWGVEHLKTLLCGSNSRYAIIWS